MSRRFGRNQKRALKKRIAELEAATAMDRGLLNFQTNKIIELEGEIKHAKAIVGAYSILFKPPVVGLDNSSYGYVEIAKLQKPSFGKEDLASQAGFSRIPLPVMLTTMEDRITDLHCLVRFSDGIWGYAIKKQTLANIPQDIAVHHISTYLARAIVSDLRKAA